MRQLVLQRILCFLILFLSRASKSNDTASRSSDLRDDLVAKFGKPIANLIGRINFADEIQTKIYSAQFAQVGYATYNHFPVDVLIGSSATSFGSSAISLSANPKPNRVLYHHVGRILSILVLQTETGRKNMENMRKMFHTLNDGVGYKSILDDDETDTEYDGSTYISHSAQFSLPGDIAETFAAIYSVPDKGERTMAYSCLGRGHENWCAPCIRTKATLVCELFEVTHKLVQGCFGRLAEIYRCCG